MKLSDNPYFKTYYPLLVILGLVFASSLAIAMHSNKAWMPLFMGMFFVFFSLFKFLDLAGFENGFKMYDEVAKRYSQYATAYPYIELVLGLLYLNGAFPVITNILTILVMGAGFYGVVKSIRSGEEIKCACLGTIIDIPLSKISALEYILMGAMAFVSLLTL